MVRVGTMLYTYLHNIPIKYLLITLLLGINRIRTFIIAAFYWINRLGNYK